MIFSRTSRADIAFDIIIYILLTIALLVVAYPLIFIVLASISNPDAVNSGQVVLFPKDISFESYKRIFSDVRIWIGYRNTIIYTAVGTFFNVALTLMIGYSVSRKDLVGRKLIMNVLIFTMYFGGGLIPTYILVRDLGLRNNPLVMVILGAVSVYNIIITRTFFESTISNELLEAAFIDGCGNGIFFFKIVLPLSKAIIAVLTIYYAVGHWNQFFNALIYITQKKYFPLQLYLRDILIANQMVSTDGMNDVDALIEMQRIAETIKYGVIIVSSLPMLILYPTLQRFFVKGVMIGAVKG